MAREMGLNPLKLVKNIPSPSEQWKAPVGVWLREIYAKRHGRRPSSGPSGRSRSLPPIIEAPEESAEWLPATFEEDFVAEPERTWEEEIAEENRLLLRRQEELRAAADYVASALTQIPAVQKVVLFGSVAQPLRKEVPRFRKFRRAGVTLWHECKDVDLAVWVSDVTALRTLQKARSQAVNDLFDDRGVGVAHHQVDVFLFEPGSDRYLGRLCHFGTCPKGKPECRVPGCGSALFLRQHEDFTFDPSCLAPGVTVLLFDKARSIGPPAPAPWDDEIPF